ERAVVAHELVGEPMDLDAPIGYRADALRNALGHFALDCGRPGARLFDGHVRAETRVHLNEVFAVFGRLFGRDAERNPDVFGAARKVERRGHHADDGMRGSVERDPSSDDVVAAAKVRYPEAMADHSDVAAARDVF